MEIIKCMLYAIGTTAIIWLFEVVAIYGIYWLWNRKSREYVQTDLLHEVICIKSAMKAIDSCKTSAEAQIKVWKFCEYLGGDAYSDLRQIVISYFERKFNVKNISEDDFLKKALADHFKGNKHLKTK